MPNNKMDRLAENEAVFREINEDIKDWEKAGKPEERNYHSTKVGFYCECSDPACKENIEITPAEYEDIHIRRKQFILKPDHEFNEVEDVIEENEGYVVAEKKVRPPEIPQDSLRIV